MGYYADENRMDEDQDEDEDDSWPFEFLDTTSGLELTPKYYLNPTSSTARRLIINSSFQQLSLEWSLDSGLKLMLEGTPNMESVDLHQMAVRIGIQELEAIKAHWPKLKHLGLMPDDPVPDRPPGVGEADQYPRDIIDLEQMEEAAIALLPDQYLLRLITTPRYQPFIPPQLTSNGEAFQEDYGGDGPISQPIEKEQAVMNDLPTPNLSEQIIREGRMIRCPLELCHLISERDNARWLKTHLSKVSFTGAGDLESDAEDILFRWNLSFRLHGR
ncbi:hypothetical protein BGZ83_011004 [Gryganskiella cystojenkinii]|nr:hypothetical protein BGZ83_011004 [Gryganskiella cystojenkinii]